MPRTVIRPKELRDPTYHAYSHGIKWGNLVFIAGQLASDKEGRIVGVGDIEKQAKRIFRRMEIVLSECGGRLENIVSMVVFLKDIRDLDRFCKARADVFKRDFPASTAIQVSSFANPDALVEVNAIAALDYPTRSSE